MLWTDYTIKKEPEDADDFLIYGAKESANKRVTFSGAWNWFLKKMNAEKFDALKTADKTIVGAVNELKEDTADLKSVMKDIHNNTPHASAIKD